ncbi:class I SAM-dependent methyltransferase [Rhodopirellula sp.]|nr:class I SAM-dependent methyltransferase [Rhodopirellula sp.]
MGDCRYQLIDFGMGRKLESLSGYMIERPSPAAVDKPVRDPSRWSHAKAAYHNHQREWEQRFPWPAELLIDCGAFQMPVRPTPYGHIGLFPEQQENWRWLATPVNELSEARAALNLFGYTGASTIALAQAGYSVAHVDAAKPNVQAARQAAKCNELSDAPIRYLVDDAAKFAAREIRRQRKYQTILLDPPAYGHSPKGRAWRLERDLWPLLNDCLQLLEQDSFRLLVTGHSPEIGQHQVLEFLRQTAFLKPFQGSSRLIIDSGRSQLKDERGRSLDAGFFVRVQTP